LKRSSRTAYYFFSTIVLIIITRYRLIGVYLLPIGKSTRYIRLFFDGQLMAYSSSLSSSSSLCNYWIQSLTTDWRHSVQRWVPLNGDVTKNGSQTAVFCLVLFCICLLIFFFILLLLLLTDSVYPWSIITRQNAFFSDRSMTSAEQQFSIQR